MPFVKSDITSHTAMSLDERFTQLRRVEPRRGIPYQTGFRQTPNLRATSSSKNKRLAMQMSKRPAVVAALSKFDFQDKGTHLKNVIDRVTIGNRITGRFRSGGWYTQNPSQPTNVDLIANTKRLTLTRSQSLQSLRGSSRGFFRGRIRIGLALNSTRGLGNVKRNFRREGSIKNGNLVKQQSFRGRGNTLRGRGRGGGRASVRGRQNNPVPSREVLDQELDQYMSASRATLDKELDTYMNQTEEKWN